MTHKQRVITALAHQPPDKVPYQIDFTVPAREKMADYYGHPDFVSNIGNHLTVVPVIRVEWGVRSPDGTTPTSSACDGTAPSTPTSACPNPYSPAKRSTTSPGPTPD